MSSNMFKGRPRQDAIHNAIMELYERIANKDIKTYAGIISYMKSSDSFGRISNNYKIRSQVMCNLKNVAEKEYNIPVTAESIFHMKHEDESLASLSAKICLNDSHYNKIISKNVTAVEYLSNLFSEGQKPSEIANQMISLGIKDKKCIDLFVKYVADFTE